MFLLHSSFDDDSGMGRGGVGGCNVMLAVNPLCKVNVDDSFPLSHETNLHAFHAFSVF